GVNPDSKHTRENEPATATLPIASVANCPCAGATISFAPVSAKLMRHAPLAGAVIAAPGITSTLPDGPTVAATDGPTVVKSTYVADVVLSDTLILPETILVENTADAMAAPSSVLRNWT